MVLLVSGVILPDWGEDTVAGVRNPRVLVRLILELAFSARRFSRLALSLVRRKSSNSLLSWPLECTFRSI